eukprot:m51a1_g6726 hypothetical protein (624) ;mRNA; r:178863-181134
MSSKKGSCKKGVCRAGTMEVTAAEGKEFVEKSGGVADDPSNKKEAKKEAPEQPKKAARAGTMEVTAQEGKEFVEKQQGAAPDAGEKKAAAPKKQQQAEKKELPKRVTRSSTAAAAAEAKKGGAEEKKSEEPKAQANKKAPSPKKAAPKKKVTRAGTMEITAQEGQEFVEKQEEKEKKEDKAEEQPQQQQQKMTRAGTMALTIAEAKKFLGTEEGRKKICRAGTMSETVEEARRLLKIDAFWKLSDADEKKKEQQQQQPAAMEVDSSSPSKGKKGAAKKSTPTPKAKKNVKATETRGTADRAAEAEDARKEAREEQRNADRTSAAVVEAWGEGAHTIDVLYLSQERSAGIEGVTAKTTLGEFFAALKKEFSVEEATARLVVHSPLDGSYRQIDGSDKVFRERTLAQIGVLPSDTLHLMNTIFIIPEGATSGVTKNLSSVTLDCYWGYPAQGACSWTTRDYLDATCMAFSKDGKKLGFVDWRERAWKFMTHSGNLMNDEARQGHDKITIDFTKIDADVGTLFFFASAWFAEHVNALKDPTVSILDQNNEELCPPHVKEFGTNFRALILCALTRSATEGAWDVIALGKGSDGNTREYPKIEKTLVDTCLPIVTAARHTVEEAAPKP